MRSSASIVLALLSASMSWSESCGPTRSEDKVNVRRRVSETDEASPHLNQLSPDGCQRLCEELALFLHGDGLRRERGPSAAAEEAWLSSWFKRCWLRYLLVVDDSSLYSER